MKTQYGHAEGEVAARGVPSRRGACPSPGASDLRLISRQELPGVILWSIRALGVMLALLLTGCNTPSKVSVVRDTQPWAFGSAQGIVILTDHYRIHSTVDDQDFLESLAITMESALRVYRSLSPGVELTSDPMDCYVFADRPEWTDFTLQRGGEDAAVFLQIVRGGYTVHDWWAAYFIGDVGTRAVAAHEGWHQFVGRHFKARLPAFLEEGIATMFEHVSWDGRGARWDNTPSRSIRARKLAYAIEDDMLWPLDQLVAMHAGDVVGLPIERRETFYAQTWAFAMFLTEADQGRRRPALQKMLNDAAAGSGLFAQAANRPAYHWSPRQSQAILEHYLETRIKRIDREYQAYIRTIAAARRE